tara:strand:- start:1530 stop:1907 length:378 start_codon:yes stop_codon:yes gene_type:complete
MATEILVNDGGAPARILPFTAGATLSGGEAVIMSADGEIDPAGAAATNVLGFMFTDATSGNNCSVITGKGVVINALVSGTAASGALLQVEAGGDLKAGTTADAGVAIMIDNDTGGAAALRKVVTQ